MIPKKIFDSVTRNYCLEHGVSRRSAARAAIGGERELGAFTLPPFQRASVWTTKQDKLFIESIWLGLPIASYVVNVDDQSRLGYPCDNWLLDGQQRWTAIIGYVNDEFSVFGLLFSDLTKAQRRGFMNHPFSSIETTNLTAEQCLEIYNRLVYGGTNH